MDFGLWETYSVPKSNLRIVKRTPVAISLLGVRKYCDAQFKSSEPLTKDAKAELRAQFDAHKCKPLEAKLLQAILESVRKLVNAVADDGMITKPITERVQ